MGQFVLLHHSSILLCFLIYVQLLNAPSSAVAAPTAQNKVAQAEATGNDDGGIDSDLQSRLDNLRKM